MGKYNDIWSKAKEYEKSEKSRKSLYREEKRKRLEEAKNEEILAQVEDWGFNNEIIDSEEDTIPIGATMDYKIIKNYNVPPFNPGTPNLEKNGALKKYKDRFGKYLAFIDAVKYYRSSKYCSILALATTSQVFLSIWGSEQNVSNAFHKLEEIGLIKEYIGYYQTGMCKLYCYFVENERLLIDYCRNNDISKMVIPNQQILTGKQVKEYKTRCEEIYTEGFKKKVAFKAKLTLKRPKGVKPAQFKRDICEMLYENYPGFRIYQKMTETINKTYYKDQPEFQIRFKPKFHWNENPKNERSKDKESIVGIGIRATNKLCSAKKDNDVIDSELKKILREEVLSMYGFKFEKDITSSVPRVAYALNHGGWLKEDVDLYKRIYEEVNPDGSEEDFDLEREAIKKLFFRVYFDTTDNKLGYHTWDHMVQDGMDKDSVYEDMKKLRRAMERVLGEKRYDNFIFYVESCIYIDTLYTLLKQGYKVWLVYDCFYGAGVGTDEEFKKLVQEAVWVSFVRFKEAYDFDMWGEIFDSE
jgi:hypothetical protein